MQQQLVKKEVMNLKDSGERYMGKVGEWWKGKEKMVYVTKV